MGLSTAILMQPPYSLDQATAQMLAPAMTEAFASHYQGDEHTRPVSPQTQGIIAFLQGQGDPLSLLMANALLGIFHDPTPVDNDVRLNLLSGSTNP